MILRPIDGLTAWELRTHLEVLHGVIPGRELPREVYVQLHREAHASDLLVRVTRREIKHEHIEPPLYSETEEFSW